VRWTHSIRWKRREPWIPPLPNPREPSLSRCKSLAAQRCWETFGIPHGWKAPNRRRPRAHPARDYQQRRNIEQVNPTDLIRKKRDGEALSSAEIHSFITGYLHNEVTDYHMSAFLMAVYFKGMTAGETFELMREMRSSGTSLDLSSIPGRKVDKHSTGG